MTSPIVLDNDAVLVNRIDDASKAAGGSPIRYSSAVLVGVQDGTGALLHRASGEDRYFPVSRGRVDWLGTGELRALAGSGSPFGEALVVELRSLPGAPGV